MPEELMKIIHHYAMKKKLVISPDADKEMNEIVIAEYRSRDRSFGNARMALSLVDEAKMNMARRLMLRPNVRDLKRRRTFYHQYQRCERNSLHGKKEKAETLSR
jgi:hypothetical protein